MTLAAPARSAGGALHLAHKIWPGRMLGPVGRLRVKRRGT